MRHHTVQSVSANHWLWNAAAYILVPSDGLVDVARRELVELLVVPKDDDCNVDGAEDGKLVSLLEEAAFALQKGAAKGQSQPRWRQGAKLTRSGCGHP